MSEPSPTGSEYGGPAPSMPSRYITPETIMRLRFGTRAWPKWDIGVLCFRGPAGCEVLLRQLGARPVGQKTLYGFEESRDHPYVHEAVLGGRRIILASRCLWGGPQTAILVEELACLGVRVVIGFGVAGALVADLPKGTQIVASSGIVTDGTTRAYTTLDEVPGDSDLTASVHVVADRLGVELAPVSIATVDALYRETEDDVRRWLGRGARAINMETAPLYAASAVCGLKSVWVGHISDSLAKSSWETWERPAEMTEITAAITAALLGRLVL